MFLQCHKSDAVLLGEHRRNRRHNIGIPVMVVVPLVRLLVNIDLHLLLETTKTFLVQEIVPFGARGTASRGQSVSEP